MSRGTAVGVPITRPIVEQLPSIYLDSTFLREFTSGLDTVWAPAMSVLDCLHAYVDPAVTPDDFLIWLGDWVGARLDEDWDVARRRRFVAAAADIFATRGTTCGLRRELELYTGGSVRVDDPGGVFTSRVPTTDDQKYARRTSDRTVRVLVDVSDAADVNWPALQGMTREATPAHLPLEIEVGAIGPVDTTPTTTSRAEQQPRDEPT